MLTAATAPAVASSADPPQAAVRLVPVAHGYAGSSVNSTIFRREALATHGKTQFIAFYSPEGRMTLGRRQLDSIDWELHDTGLGANPPRGVGDAHNVISLAVDGEGHLHVSWGMHGERFNYARGREPLGLELADPQTMTGERAGITYPEFLNLPDGDLLFLYRQGGSGRGNLHVNRYEVESGKWLPVHQPLIDGAAADVNPYTTNLLRDADGVLHLSWCWRSTPDVRTNHDVLYSRSTDEGRSWVTAGGKACALPIVKRNDELVLRIPQESDLINQTTLAADAEGRPIIATWWSPAGDGVQQIMVIWQDAGGAWHTAQVTDRATPFDLAGAGTKPIPLSRPLVLVDPVGGGILIVYRDLAERGGRVSLAWTDRLKPELKPADWGVTDLTDFSVGAWEPSFDRSLWERDGLLHLFVQPLTQGDGDRAAEADATAIHVLEWDPRRLQLR